VLYVPVVDTVIEFAKYAVLLGGTTSINVNDNEQNEGVCIEDEPYGTFANVIRKFAAVVVDKLPYMTVFPIVL
jgi:hypothetical protein